MRNTLHAEARSGEQHKFELHHASSHVTVSRVYLIIGRHYGLPFVIVGPHSSSLASPPPHTITIIIISISILAFLFYNSFCLSIIMSFHPHSSLYIMSFTTFTTERVRVKRDLAYNEKESRKVSNHISIVQVPVSQSLSVCTCQNFGIAFFLS